MLLEYKKSFYSSEIDQWFFDCDYNQWLSSEFSSRFPPENLFLLEKGTSQFSYE